MIAVELNRPAAKPVSRSTICRRLVRPVWTPFEVVTTPGFLHSDMKYLIKLNTRCSYVHVGMDSPTRYVSLKFALIEAAEAAGFLARLLAAFTLPVRVIVSDRGFEWTDWTTGYGRGRSPAGPRCPNIRLIDCVRPVASSIERL